MSNIVPTKLSDLTKYLFVTTLKAGNVISDNDTFKIDGKGVITEKLGNNAISRQDVNQIELLDDGIYIDALNE